MISRKFTSVYMVAICFIAAVFYNTGRAESIPVPEGMVALTDVADSTGFTWRWDRQFRRLICRHTVTQLRFYEENRYYYRNGMVACLPVAPRRIDGTLYLPREMVLPIFGTAPTGTEPSRDVHPDMMRVSSEKPGNNILAVAAEKKQNGTLFTITLADSLPLDVTYYYPNITFNFYGGKVDTQLIRQGRRIGLIDSVFSIQFAASAQITALLSREIDEPMIDYVEDTRTIMVSLWPRKNPPVVKKKKPVAKPAAVSSDKTIIVIDPGHGGKDPGAISTGGVKEKDVVLSIGLKLYNLLKKQPNLKVYMTRDDDVFIPLRERTSFANNKKAHLFISIHADAISGNSKRKNSIRGYKIYFLSQAKNEEDKLVAMRENAVIELEEQPQHYSNLQNVLIEMAGNEFLRESQDLCIALDRKFSSQLTKKITKLHLGIGQANFWVLNGAFMPSVLIETGFLSHPKEEKLLSNKKFQSEMAESISHAVSTFCEKYETGL